MLGLARTDAPADISITLIGSCMGCIKPHFPPRAAPCVHARCSPVVPPLLLAVYVGRIILSLLNICMGIYKSYSMLCKVVIVSWKRNTWPFCAAVSFGGCLLCLSLFASPSLYNKTKAAFFYDEQVVSKYRFVLACSSAALC